MRSMLLIAQREIVQRRMAFVAAVVASLLPLVARWAPLPIGGDRTLASFILVAILVVSFGGALALVLGASMIGRDLGERRLSFYLTRPLTPASIWYGKLLGSFLIAFLSAAIVLIPAALFAPDVWRGNWTLSLAATIGVLALAVLAVVLFAHVAGTMVRSRSAWLLVDLAVALFVVVSCGLVVRDGWRAGATLVVSLEIVGIIVTALLVALIAGEIQLRRGRVDIARNHRALSVSLWTGLLVMTAAMISWGVWLKNPSPRAFRSPGVAAPAAGPWIALDGHAHGRFDYPAALLLNTANGSTLRIRSDEPYWRTSVRFAASGRRVIWIDSLEPRGSMIGVADLGTRARAWHFAAPDLSRVEELAISEDGSRVATLADGVLAVFDAREGRSVAAFHLDGEVPDGHRTTTTPPWETMWFSDDDHIRLCRASADRRVAGLRRSLTIDEIDVRTKRVTRTGAFEAPGSQMTVSPSAGRLLVTVTNDDLRGDENRRRFVLDGRTGAVLRALDGKPQRLLQDGAVAWVQRRNDRFFLIIDKSPAREISLGGVANAFLAPSVAPGSVTVVLIHSTPNAAVREETLLVDETSGRITHRLPARPVSWSWNGWAELRDPGPGARLFYEGERIVRFDPATGRIVVVAGI